MRTLPIRFQRGLPWLALLLALTLSQSLRASVGITVTPATVSNTYSGTLTLQVTGLSTGETVVVQKYLDANTNGIIDGADWLWQQFRLTDGQVNGVGGVANINVPGDSDALAGQITARMDFQSTDPLLNVIGQYTYRLSSPTGLFGPFTNSFAITNAAYGQSLNGNVVHQGINVPNAVVLLFMPKAGSSGPGWSVGGTVANNSGAYSIKVPAGTYRLLAVKSNYLCDLHPSPVVVSHGATVNTNLFVSAAALTLSGRIVDAADHAIGLPGLFVHAQAGGLVAGGASDTNGNFTLRVGPGQWGVGATGLEALGYVQVDSEYATFDTTTGSVTGATIPYPKANALFYGSVKDDQGQALAGILIQSENDDYSSWYNAVTDGNGDYVTGVVGGGNWDVGVDDEHPSSTNYIFSPGITTNVSSGQTIRYDFTAFRATNHISGYLLDNLGQPISNKSIYAYATIGGKTYSAAQETDANGYYSLNAVNGTWTVYVCNGDYDSCLNSDYFAPPSQTVGITNNNGVADFIATIAPHHITGSVRDGNNNPVSNAYVYATAMINGSFYFQWGWADASGNYRLGVQNGIWDVGLNCGVLSDLGYGCVDSQPVTINNADGLADFVVQSCALQITSASPLPVGEVDTPYDFQFQASGCDNNFTWSLTGPIALPPGLYLEPDGWLEGWPDIPGTYSFFVRVQDSSGHAVERSFSLVILPASTGGATDYYVAKLKAHRQSNAVTIDLDNSQGPFNAYLGIIQASLDLVTNATCTLPNSVAKGFPSGTSALDLQVHQTFATEPALESVYPAGDYLFAMHTRNDGNQSAVLNLAATPLPGAPRVSNHAAAQAINPASPFDLHWDAFPGGTNDSIRLAIFDSNVAPAFRLWWYPEAVFEEWLAPGETSMEIPASQLEASHAYLGLLQFIRFTDFNDVDYPNAYGTALICAQTAFSLTTRSAAPELTSPERLSPTQFQFLLNGLPGGYYAIQKSTNLNSTSWSTLIITNAPAVIVDASATNRNAFYRAVSAPPP